MTGMPSSPRPSPTASAQRVALLRWTAQVGAISSDALAHLQSSAPASARAFLGRLACERLLARRRLLADEPSLYTVTRSALRLADLPPADPSRVNAGNAVHTLACVRAAASLQRCYPAHTIVGERELRRRELSSGRTLASVQLAGGGGRQLHRPDLVLVGPDGRVDAAIEIELTVKAPRRLVEICRAWELSREVAGVVYLAPASVRRALDRAIERAGAERIVVLPLDSLALLCRSPGAAREKHPKRCVR
jgi:hypothetical protein